MKVTFIGLGIMGVRMAANILKGGIELTISNRSREKGIELEKNGANFIQSGSEAVKDADVVITMLSKPEVVEDAALGTDGFLRTMRTDAIWIDMSTVNPSFSVRMAESCKKFGIRFMDCPVAGSKIPAEKGELSILVGGSEEDFSKVKELLLLMGKNLVYAGEAGKGASMKMVVNLMLAGAMEIYSEAVHLGENLGLSKEVLFNSLVNLPVAAPLLKMKTGKIQNGDYEPEFPLEWMLKDLHLLSITAYENHTPMPVAHSLKQVYAAANRKGYGRKDFSAVYKYLME